MTEFSHDSVRVTLITFAEAQQWLDQAVASTPFSGSHSRQREKLLTEHLLRHCPEVTDPRLLRHDPDGAPYIEGSPINISISHSRNEVAIARSSRFHPGIDIETPREALRRVASRFLTPREQEYYLTIGQLLRAWVIKEAVYKAMHIKHLSSQQINLSCAEPTDGKDTATVNGQTLSISLHRLPSGSLLAVTSDNIL